MTLATPQGPLIASNVVKSSYTHKSQLTVNRTTRYRTRVWGDALTFDLGDRGHLFGVLGTVDGINAKYAFRVWQDTLLWRLLPEQEKTVSMLESGEIYERVNGVRGPRTWDPGAWPVLIHLSDVMDLRTAKFVPYSHTRYELAPATRMRSFESVLGAGARVQEVSIEIVNDFVTRRLPAGLRWIDQMNGSRFNNDGFNYRKPLPENLRRNNFTCDGYAIAP